MSGMTTRALVLAGGGLTGIGWELGVMFGLGDAGVDIDGWNRIIGTSAGAVVGAALGQPGDLDALLDALATMDGERLRRVVGGRDPSLVSAIDELWFGPRAASDGPDEAARVAIGRLAVMDDPELAGAYLAAIQGMLPTSRWPAALVVTATDAQDGSTRTFDAGSGIPLGIAVAASCAVPGMFPPVRIGGRTYMDGGVRSASNADLAAGHDLVVVVAPNRSDGQWAERLGSEARGLQADGTRVVEILLDDASLATFGTDTMDRSTAGPAMVAGRALGLRAGIALAGQSTAEGA